MPDPETNIPVPESAAPVPSLEPTPAPSPAAVTEAAAKVAGDALAGAAKGGTLGAITAIISDISAGEVIATGAVALIVKLKGILSNHSDISVQIENLNADAAAQYQAEIDEGNAWLKARNYPTVE